MPAFMKFQAILVFAALLPAAAFAAPTNGAAAPRTMRLDYFHTGDAASETFSLDRIVREPLPWPGNPHRPFDETNLGKYFFVVVDRATNRPLYSRGFASVYGEWETTDEAKGTRRTFSESLRFPEPAAPVQVVIKKRDAKNAFVEIWSAIVDAKDIFVDSAAPAPAGPILEIQKTGDPAGKVDFLILGDGYTAGERAKFEKDAKRLADLLFQVEPFKSHRADFNVWGICPPAEESGISRPSTGIHRRSRIGATYDAFGVERYILTFENRSFRDVASLAPYEFVEILTNSRPMAAAGSSASTAPWRRTACGRRTCSCTSSATTSRRSPTSTSRPRRPTRPRREAHRAMGTERDGSPRSGQSQVEGLVTPGTPIPTPWAKEEFEKTSREFQAKRRAIRAANASEDQMDALFKEELVHETKLLGGDRYAGRVGAFEGALYESRGYYRPQEDCIMFTRDEVPFCAVCRRAIEGIIDLYTEGAAGERREAGTSR